MPRVRLAALVSDPLSLRLKFMLAPLDAVARYARTAGGNRRVEAGRRLFMLKLIYSACAALFLFLQDLVSRPEGRMLPFISKFRWTCFVLAVMILIGSAYRN